jgi:hypothetical protein
MRAGRGPYPVIYKVPIAFCEVDVKLVGDGEEARGMMVAGHVGRLTEGEHRDTVRPLLGWFMFVKESHLVSASPPDCMITFCAVGSAEIEEYVYTPCGLHVASSLTSQDYSGHGISMNK